MNGQLPEIFYLDGVGVKEPCYKLIAPIQADDTYWNEGEIIATDMIPNEAMQPLNRAAGEKVDAWLRSLPANGNIKPEDYMAAALQLRPKVGEEEMPHEAWIAAVRQLALEMRAKAEGKPVEELRPKIGRPAPSNAPPMSNIEMVQTGIPTRKKAPNKEARVKHMAQPQPTRVQPKPEQVGGIVTQDYQQPTS